MSRLSIKKIAHFITLLSLLFLGYYLYRSDILHLPIIYRYDYLALSLLLLWGGFLAQAVTWQRTLQGAGYRASLAACLAGSGLSVFAKYIPGKVMVIVGRAAFVSERYGYDLASMTALSLSTQLVTLWVGLSIGALGLAVAGGGAWVWLTVLLWLALTVAVFSSWVNRLLSAVLRKLLRRNVQLPQLGYQQVLHGWQWYVLNWLLWAAGFYALCVALHTGNVPLVAGLGYPLAITLGIAAMLTPGGMGVREGMITAYLVLLGLALPVATSLSVASRLWFLVGEVWVFVAGWLAQRYVQPSDTTA